MVKLATLNLAKLCQIFEIIALHGGFDGGHQVQNACHHQSSKNHATLMNLLMLDFRHYIPHYIRTKCRLGNRKYALRNQRWHIL